MLFRSTKVVLLQERALTRHHADRALVFFRTTALKDMAYHSIKDFAKNHNIRGLFAKDVLPAHALIASFRLNATGLALRRAQLVTSFRVINRHSAPILLLVRPGKVTYEDAQPEDLNTTTATTSASTQRDQETSSRPPGAGKIADSKTPAGKNQAGKTGAGKKKQYHREQTKQGSDSDSDMCFD